MKLATKGYEGLSQADFIFPVTEQFVLPGKRADNPKIHIGFHKWNDTRWEGKFYPVGTKKHETLVHYAAHFNTVEFHSTRYNFLPKEQLEQWISQVGDNEFTFCPLFHTDITKKREIFKSPNGVNTFQFLKQLKIIEKKLGPAILTLLKEERKWILKDLLIYLENLPADLTVFVETYTPDWFETPGVIQEFARELNKLQKGWVIVDTPQRRDNVHLQLSVPKAMVRFVCEGNAELDVFRIDQWKNLLTYWFQNGLQDCWFFLHVLDDKAAKDMGDYIKSEFASVIK